MSSERDQAYFDIFTTAVEGGIGYWSVASDYHIYTNPGAHWKELQDDLLGFHVTLLEIENPLDEDSPVVPWVEWQGERFKPLTVDRGVIAKGVRLFCEQDWRPGSYAAHAATALIGRKWDYLDIDADLADRIVQLGLFGEIVYG